MTSRIATAAVGLPLLLLVVWVDHSLPFTALCAAAAALGAWELSGMARHWGDRPLEAASAGLAAALVASAQLLPLDTFWATLSQSVALLLSALALAWLLRRGTPDSRPARLLATLAPALFVGGLLFHAPLLRAADSGREWILLLLLTTFATDTGAYLLGKAVGRTPLAPAISPAKTREGAAGGLLSAVAACMALDAILGLPATWWQAALLGGALGIVGQLGDLTESRLKRIADVKDSGQIMPGHGGLLDRLDSVTLNVVVVYYFVL